jgi:hypothetical protein
MSEGAHAHEPNHQLKNGNKPWWHVTLRDLQVDQGGGELQQLDAKGRAELCAAFGGSLRNNVTTMVGQRL